MIDKDTVTATEALAVEPSRFVLTEVAKLTQSHTRIYMALILDVIHSHKAVKPAGYVASLELAAPQITMWQKYCTVIAPALSGTYALTLAAFPATATGLNNAVEWYVNQANLGGYSLSLEDMTRFFRNRASVKAQKEQERKDIELRNAASIQQAIEATAAREAANANSIARSTTEQAALEEKFNLTAIHSDVQPLEQGPALNDGWTVESLQVHTKGEAVKVVGMESMTLKTLLELQSKLDAFILAAMDAQEEELRTGTEG